MLVYISCMRCFAMGQDLGLKALFATSIMTQSGVTVLLALAFSVFFHCISGQWIRGMGENLCQGIASDYMYRFRVAVTPKSNLVYGINSTHDTVGFYNVSRYVRGFASPVWSSQTIPGLSGKQPVLNVDSRTDRVYFIHPVDGKIYCFDASQGADARAPVWVSSFVCSDPGDARDQHLQTFTSDGVLLLGRCNTSVVLLGPQGNLLKIFSGSSMRDFVAASDLAAPIPVSGNFTRMTTWVTNSSGAFLEIWQLDSPSKFPQRPAATLRLPAGVNVSGVNTDSPLWTVVADSTKPVVHVLNSLTGKYQSAFDFKTLMDPNNTLIVSLMPTPVISKRVMYGIVQATEPSQAPWLPEKYYWWMFALNYTEPRNPTLVWLTSRQVTRGPLAPQVPWVTEPAIFVTDYQQNSTRGLSRTTGQDFYNVPVNPYSTMLTQYSLLKGTYKISLPWVSTDGIFQVFQNDDWMYDLAPPGARDSLLMGYIRTLAGLPPSSPPPLSRS